MPINETAQTYIENIKRKCEIIKPLVVIRCIAYNQEKYIRSALDGFLIQKTNFPFIAIIHDDFSTDRTTEIIKEYSRKYPDLIFPIFENENQYSKKKGIITSIMDAASFVTNAKYIAECEGDDYWIDPLKLQKQVDFMEANPEYTLCATNSYFEKKDNSIKNSPYNVLYNKDVSCTEVIMGGGLFLTTATLFYKISDYKKFPRDIKFHVGDYPLQIYLTHLGKTKILSDITSVYRQNSFGSWNNINEKNNFNLSKKKNFLIKEKELLQKINEITEYKYDNITKKRMNYYSFVQLLYFSPIRELKYIIKDPITIYKKNGLKLIIFSLLPTPLKRAIKIKKDNK